MRDLNDYQQQYSAQPYERYQVHFRKKKIKEILSRYKHDTLLEIGCGLSPIFNEISSYRRLFIAEPAKLFYDKTLEDLKKSDRQKDIVIINKLIEDCYEELKDQQFDFVLLSSLLHEIPHKESFLEKIYALTSGDTTVHINVPNARSFHRLLAVEMGLIDNVFQKSLSNTQFQQYTVFDLESLISLAQQCGFRIIDSGAYSFKPFTHQQMENMIQAGLISQAILDGFYRMEKHLPDLGSEIYINITRA